MVKIESKYQRGGASMSENLDLADRLKKIRLELNLKQKEIAAELKISKATYSEVEGGNYNPNFNLIENIVLKYNVNLYYLLFGEGEMFLDAGQSFRARKPKYAVSKEEIDKLMWYLERSPVVQYLIMGHFRTILTREKDTIQKDIEDYNESQEKIGE
jgi:transcriptional regulator with XRE-family HTH domain